MNRSFGGARHDDCCGERGATAYVAWDSWADRGIAGVGGGYVVSVGDALVCAGERWTWLRVVGGTVGDGLFDLSELRDTDPDRDRSGGGCQCVEFDF